MPTTKYKIVKKGDQFCVADNETGDPIHGGKGSCHANRDDAVKQLRAIYANMNKSFSEKCLYVPTKAFSSVLEGMKNDELPWVQIFPFGHWSHPVYGDNAAVVSYDRAERYVKNFNDKVRRQDIATDYEHGEDKNKGSKASGWYRAMELRDDGVYAQIEFTETAKKEIKDGEWKYFSPLFVDLYEDAETSEVFEDVIIGGGLTNRPWMKDMVPINFSEAVLEEETTKFRFKEDKWIASDNGGESWRIATSDEVAELEHAEPGTGSPPQPRTDEDDRSGDKDGQGIRRDTPPPQDEKEFADSSKPYGNVTYADPGYQKDKKKRYPLDTVKHIRAAWSYINMPKNAAKYTSGQVASIKGKIRAAMKRIGAAVADKKMSEDNYLDTNLMTEEEAIEIIEALEEGSDMGLSVDALKLLGLEEDADEEAINTAITSAFADLPQLKEFAEKNRQAKKFSEEFPEEFKRMQELAAAEAVRGSKAFAERYERVSHTEGEGDQAVTTKTNRGPSALILDGLSTFHKKFSEGDATVGDFQGLMDMIFTDKAFVDYGEAGSSRVREDADGDGSDVAKAFAEKANAIMSKSASEGKPISWEVAVHEATQQYPDLAKAYAERQIPAA